MERCFLNSCSPLGFQTSSSTRLSPDQHAHQMEPDLTRILIGLPHKQLPFLSAPAKNTHQNPWILDMPNQIRICLPPQCTTCLHEKLHRWNKQPLCIRMTSNNKKTQGRKAVTKERMLFTKGSLHLQARKPYLQRETYPVLQETAQQIENNNFTRHRKPWTYETLDLWLITCPLPLLTSFLLHRW